LVTGRANGTSYWTLIMKILAYVGETIYNRAFPIFQFLAILSYPFPALFRFFTNMILLTDRIRVLYDNVNYDYWHYLHDNDHFLIGSDIMFTGKVGWVLTIGLNGVKKISGSLYGKIHYFIPAFDSYYFPRAITHFVGLKMCNIENGDFFIGSALRVKIGLSSSYT
jgi:hypothetical protein